jgi:hypothetical protein
MRTRIVFAAILCLFIAGVSSNGQVPQLINYQGRVAVGGTNFDGTGDFKFALVNAAGTATYWSNDGTSTAGSRPAAVVSLPVSKGIYSVLLGDATIPRMTVVPATVFANNDVRLRVWFNDGSRGWQQLTPDQRIAAVGYAMMAGSVPDGAITTPKIATGAVGSAQIATGAVGGNQLAAGIVFAERSVSGDSQDAVANASYVVTGTTATAFTLPTSANVGDIVQITGATAGWSVAPFWTARASSQLWQSIACSADATKLVACVLYGKIYTSTDSGVTWTARDSNQSWQSITSSADGTKLAACVHEGQIYTSADSGATWTARESSQQWQSVASSADGTKLVACVYGGPIYTSANSGATWTARISGDWSSVASSADGTKLVACADGGQIYTSANSGATWTARESTQRWPSVASSADGTKLTACVNGGQIYTSDDSGATWTARASSKQWQLVASSSDGTKLAACGAHPTYGSEIFLSADSGATWAVRSINQNWTSVASSADGTKLAACVYDGRIYTWSGYSGPQGTTASFRYEGDLSWVRVVPAP